LKNAKNYFVEVKIYKLSESMIRHQTLFQHDLVLSSSWFLNIERLMILKWQWKKTSITEESDSEVYWRSYAKPNEADY